MDQVIDRVDKDFKTTKFEIDIVRFSDSPAQSEILTIEQLNAIDIFNQIKMMDPILKKKLLS
jgi:hypothetical protein